MNELLQVENTLFVNRRRLPRSVEILRKCTSYESLRTEEV